MQISTKDWKNYIDKLTKLNTTAGKLMSDYVARNGFGNTDAILDYAYALVTKYGEGSAALSAEMYDTIAEMSGMILPPAEVAPTADYGEVAKAVQGTIKKSKNPNTTGGTIGRLVKQAGADTMLKNAGRDHAQFAWVPMGDTCAFCMTLASRGWQYISAKSMRNGHAEHIHANCDCNYLVRFDDKSGVKGYDPEYYRSMYDEAEGSNSKEKINSMRRIQYAERKDVINAQKRAAYAEKNDKNTVGIDVDKAFNEKSRERIQSIINRLAKEYNSPINRIVKSTKSSAGEQGFVGIGERNIIQLASTKPETLIHEFAHTLAINKEDKLGLTDNTEFWKEIRSIKRDYDKDLTKNINKKISSYASENIDEFFAEAFTQAKARQMGIQLSWGFGDDLTYTNKVLNVVDKYFGKGFINNMQYDIINKRGNVFELDLQRFAEKDISRQESNSLERGIRNLTKQIEEHKRHIDFPEEYIEDWNSKSEKEKVGLIKHWNKEIRTFQTSINDRIEELKKRGDYHG